MSVDKIFYEVFKDLPFPYFAVDLGRLNKVIARENAISPRTHVVLPLDVASEKRSVLAASWSGLLSNGNVPHPVLSALATSAPLNKSGNGRILLRNTGVNPRSSLQVGSQGIRWEQESYWPIAFSTVLSQFYMLVGLNFLAIAKQREETGARLQAKGFDPSNIKFRSEFPRLLPTRQQFAFASLGAWLAGAENLQYFGYYATIRQIHHQELNCKYLARMGFDDETAKAMDSSGLIGVPSNLLAPLLEAQGDSNLFGSLPIDEQNSANPPAIDPLRYLQDESKTAMQGVLVDKYYRAPFWTRTLAPHGLYGAKNLLRDHYSDFYAGLPIRELIRCKHYCAPVIEVSSLDEIQQYVAQIPILSATEIFFRGQTAMHTLRRDGAVKQLLFAESCSVEPSLTTSASRDLTYDYDVLHFALRQFAERSLYDGDRKLIAERTERWRDQSASPTCRLDYAIMALSQHYGLPSHGLDVTTSEDVAVWFATNRFYKEQVGGISGYNMMCSSDWAEDPNRWPVVFACQAVTNSIEPSLQNCEELEDFGILAARPERQHAKFFHGGHSDHQNRLAEAVVCVFRLRPNTYETQSTFTSLFPSPAEDAAYKLMLDFAEEHPTSWGRYINRFHAKT